MTKKKGKCIFLILLCCLSLTACQSRDYYQAIDYTQRVKVKNVERTVDDVQGGLVVAVASIISAQESFAYYDDLMSYLEKKLNKPIQTIYTKKYQDVYQLFKQGKVDLAFICSALYIIGKRERLFELLVVPIVENKSVYQAYIIVPTSSNINSFAELQDKNFAFTDELSLTGYFYPLYKTGGTAGFWKETLFSGSHDYSIQLINRGLVDGASVDGLVYEDLARRHPHKVAQIRIIEKSVEFGIPPVVVSRHVMPATRRKLQELFITMSQEEEGQQLLQLLHIDRYELPKEAQYYSIYKMVPNTARQ